VGVCLMQHPATFWLGFGARMRLFPMASGLITFLWAYIFLFLVSCFISPTWTRFFCCQSRVLGAPLFFPSGWISHSRRYACSWRSNRNNLIPILSYRFH
jgi:hypothetical protein